MELQTISQVAKYYGISVRTLRYYEQIGLINSIRKNDNAYRFYDEMTIKQLHFIIFLRKLRISVKQIRTIINHQNASTAIEIFEQGISELDEEITSLTTIKSILTRFTEDLRTKADMTVQFDLLDDKALFSSISSVSFSKNYINNVKERITMDELNRANEKVNKLTDKDVRIVYLPPMTVAASHATGEKCERKAFDALYKFVRESGLLKIKPDVRQFGFNNGQAVHGEPAHGYEVWVSIPDDIEVSAPLVKRKFHGGLYASHMIKMGDFDQWNILHEWVKTNGKYNDDWNDVRWTPFYEGMEHCLEEQLNFFNNIQNPNFDGDEMQLDLLFPIKE